MDDDKPPKDGWALTVGASMSGVVAHGSPAGPAPPSTAVLPDGQELTADEQGAFARELPPQTRIFIAGQLAMTVPAEGEAPTQS